MDTVSRTLDANGQDAAELAALLEGARAAPPDRRIESRDPIAAFGALGIQGVRPWLSDDILAAFAVRVIEQAGMHGEAGLAADVLRADRTKVPAGVTDDVTWALARLRTISHPRPAPAAAPARVAPVRRDAGRAATVIRRRAR